MAKIVPKFYGEISNGKLSLYDEEAFKKYIGSITGEVQLVLKKKEKIRSLQQCRYYWGVIVPLISREWGEDEDTVHDYLKARFLKYRKCIKTPKGEKVFVLVGSTAKLKTDEFVEFNEKAKIWASQNLNCYIPDPGEVDIGVYV